MREGAEHSASATGVGRSFDDWNDFAGHEIDILTIEAGKGLSLFPVRRLVRDHGIEPEEAEECFFHDFLFSLDHRRFDDVYLLEGKTDRGRRLRLVFQDKGSGLVRVFTGWELESKRQR